MSNEHTHSKGHAHTHEGGETDAWCEACNREVHANRPAWYWKLARAAVWGFCVMLLTGYVMIGMGAIGATVLTPFILFLCTSMLTVVHDEAGKDPTCPRCRRMVVSLEEHAAEARSLATKRVAPAHA